MNHSEDDREENVLELLYFVSPPSCIYVCSFAADFVYYTRGRLT